MSPLEKHSSMSVMAKQLGNKPIMEKKRRARINNCLNELKNLLLENKKKDPYRYSKLEKADILEMAVHHLQQLQKPQRQVKQEAQLKRSYRQCANPTPRRPNVKGFEETEVKNLVDEYLNNVIGSSSTTPQTAGFYYNNGFLISLTPKRLPSGDVALLLPPELTFNRNGNDNQHNMELKIPKNVHSLSPSMSTSDTSNSSHLCNCELAHCESSAPLSNKFSTNGAPIQNIHNQAYYPRNQTLESSFTFSRILQSIYLNGRKNEQSQIGYCDEYSYEQMWRPW